MINHPSKSVKGLFFLFIGFSLGITLCWPGVLTRKGRECFVRIINDGRDGDGSLNTVFSIEPIYLFKINNTQNKYFKILLISDHCFRKF